jgi:hypothetical protein
MGLKDVVNQRRKQKDKPKTLAELRARKQAKQIVLMPEKPDNSLAGVKARKLAAASAKRDFTIGGLRYHNVVQENGYWKIDVSNNDITYTMHNRYGSWMHSLSDREGYMKEPAWVALALGTSVSQVDMARNLIARQEIEMKARGIPTHEEKLRMQEEAEKAERRKKRKKDDNTDDKDAEE